MLAETRYQPVEAQLAVAAALESSIDGLLPLRRLHDSTHESEAVWNGLEDVGVFAIGRAESEGGAGLGAVEEALIVMDLGRRLASPGVLATVGASAIAGAGRTLAAWRDGERIVAVDEPGATRVLVRESAGAALHDGSVLANSETLDERLWLAKLRSVTLMKNALLRIDPQQLLRLRLMDAAALTGMADASLRMAVAYAGAREQFGRPIGSFQAVKHHCANMAIAARSARDQLTFAAVALDESRADAALQVECALLGAGSAALDNAGLNIQIHGGMGFSDEADPHLFLKRARLQIAIAGGLDACAARIAGIEPHG